MRKRLLRVLLLRNKGELVGFAVEGHAGFAPEGKDIVCAGISALAQTALFSLERVVGVKTRAEVKKGFLYCRPLQVDEKVKVVLETFALGAREIAKAYPGYVEVKEVEEDEGV